MSTMLISYMQFWAMTICIY